MPRKTTKTTKTTKRVIKKSAPAVAVAPEMHECQCGAACKCGCHHGKFKKFIVLLIVFLLGFAVAKMVPCHKFHRMHKGMQMHPVFQNGCLDMASIKCPKMVETLQASEANADGCITMGEFKEIKKAMHREMRNKMPEQPAPEPVVAEQQ